MQHNKQSLVHLLFLYLWPFWMFQDATRGNIYERAAAFRHNREKSVYLPGYVAKWVLLSGASLALAEAFAWGARKSQTLCSIFGCLSAGAGMLFTVGFCILMITGYTYLCLTRVER
jgi:hypothetical protein